MHESGVLNFNCLNNKRLRCDLPIHWKKIFYLHLTASVGGWVLLGWLGFVFKWKTVQPQKSELLLLWTLSLNHYRFQNLRTRLHRNVLKMYFPCKNNGQIITIVRYFINRTEIILLQVLLALCFKKKLYGSWKTYKDFIKNADNWEFC